MPEAIEVKVHGELVTQHGEQRGVLDQRGAPHARNANAAHAAGAAV